MRAEYIDDANQELYVLQYFDKVKESNHIVKMLKHEIKQEDNELDTMYIVLELEGHDLFDYLAQQIKGSSEEEILETSTYEDNLIKIIGGAALPLKQFHQHGIHGDVKLENFVLAKEQSQNDVFVKLIDFSTSVLENQSPTNEFIKRSVPYKAPEIWNTNNACVYEDPKKRPNIDQIVEYLYNDVNIDYHLTEEEQKEIKNRERQKIEDERFLKKLNNKKRGRLHCWFCGLC
uniref:Protein kinase domain-containing protein n=1 Tax=Meloidogyne hapla TaxID=6305 RepID=A0A1I8B804_MELHA